MSDVDDAIERAEKHPFHPIYEDWPDRQTLAAEVKRLRELNIKVMAENHEYDDEVKRLQQEMADCRKGIVRWEDKG